VCVSLRPAANVYLGTVVCGERVPGGSQRTERPKTDNWMRWQLGKGCNAPSLDQAATAATNRHKASDSSVRALMAKADVIECCCG
jgi:hypothetical protein